ncbi:chitobiase/beta-hexosaminidase C-terminal domain-containing protein [Maribacter arenosus]|uniref:Chitobiase/beta-hexosaminidase C-terminal domain-containing protein n=1 Tax=Maribacter arenosus TaxID=1854708 RepID=A0ABR7VB57_9FLAO|nr:chitobiase/beta-hexosaminidase C-terminal domain-containing protein [Maribacter arenosus]MBD0850886.1 chitobiase/beta-hexosaminidase C-terminal domain-containing protein [Maribacter arenosus]
MIAQTLQIGNLHPLVIHLPIGILIIGFVLEIGFRKKPSDAVRDILLMVLGFGALTAIISLGTGWLLADNGGYDETLLFRHRWLAVAFTVLTAGLYFLKRSATAIAKKLYMPLYIVVLILIGITGHYGGSMTHGEDFLFADKTTQKVVIEDVDKALVYNDIIQPIFDNKCVSCHNTSKIKGGLLMDTKENLLAGGDSGSILDSVAPDKPSLFLHHLQLPLEDEDHMPPKGKVQPTADELALLEWWMAHGHCFDCVVGTMEKTEQLQKILKNLEEDTSTRAMIAKEVSVVPNAWLADLNSSNISASRLAIKSPLILINLYGRTDLTPGDFKALKKYAKNIVELNLGHTNFNDTLAPSLKAFKNLTKLQLQKTAIAEKSIDVITEFEHLESLNLYGTEVDNKAFEKLENLPKLTHLYLWQTNITKEAMDAFANAHPEVNVQGQIDSDIFKATKLEPPTIIADTDFFKDSLQIAMEYVFNDAQIFYTLDGSIPDSTSLPYSKPLTIHRSTEVKAVTHAPGWNLSEVTASSFKKISFDVNAITLNKNPNERYKGHGAQTLIDQKRGTVNFVDGNWIGFEGSNFTATIQLGKEEQVSSVSVGAFSSPEKWIFYPTGFKVWTSMNGTDFKLAKTLNVGPEEINTNTKFRFFDMDIAPTSAKYVRVQVNSQLKNPEWHPNPGGNSWLFVDEIVLN